ncbi:protein SINE1-like [Lotus japonicus]|uniref:protein SINE1-like n=1 Tax=Lotus japonicus TaxID=34305 RepID=UPI002582E094|nr:protein SINE1-like [Lotus japonicus]XP_057445823.1 protein SINE1-like [Lotus japonicus]
MGRSLTPVLQRELENLDKDADSRKSAMRALKSYVKDLDYKTIPIFLAQVSETKETGTLSGEFTISLYEVLARVHGVKIVPLIDSIMQSIVQTLASSAGSFPLQQACSKVVPAVARYGIDPTTADEKKRSIIHSICKPLSDSLSSSQESLSCGAALCLKALVDSDNWRYASDEIVNRVCQNVAVALEEKSTQTNSHMGLVMALAKRNALIVEAYARLLIQSGLQILHAGGELLEGNSQKRFAAIQMVNFLMKCLDPRSIFSEAEQIIEVMELCQSDKMAYVKGAAFEALQSAKRIAIDKKTKCLKSPAAVTGSNFSRRDYTEGGSFYGDGDHSPTSMSPESRTFDFFPGYESLVESPFSTSDPSQNFNYARRSVNRKLWSHENGGVDVKDGLFSKAGQGNGLLGHAVDHEFPNGGGDLAEEFDGFLLRSPRRGVSESTSTSPLRSRSQVNVDTIKIFTTPRKLIHSLQDLNDETSDCSENLNKRIRNLSSGNIKWNPACYSKYDKNGIADHVNYDCKENESSCGDVQFQGGPESVSSTDELLGDADMQSRNDILTVLMEKPIQKAKRKLVCGLSFVIIAMATPLLWINSQEEGHFLVPT